MPLNVKSAPERALNYIIGHDATGKGGKLSIKALADSVQYVDRPSGFGWNFATYPVEIYKDGPRHFKTDFDPRSVITSNVWNGPEYFVSSAGNDSNAGTSESAPVASIWKARELLEASVATGGIIHVKVDTAAGYTVFDRNSNFNKTSGTTALPTKPTALMAYGGRAFMGSLYNGISWTYDATSGTYSSLRGNVASVIDFSRYAKFGIINRLPKIAGGTDLAATRTLVGAGEGQYALSNDGYLVIKLEDGKPVNNTTVKVTALTLEAFRPGLHDSYMSGFSLVGGGTNGLYQAYDTATRNLVLENCDLSFGGVDGGGAVGHMAIDNMTGILVMKGCSGKQSLNDIVNGHSTTGNLHMLLIDCEGEDAGRAGASPVTLSNQITTIHETVKMISLNTRGSRASGGCVRNIGSSQHWDLGSVYGGDRGDLHFSGGDIPSTGVRVDNSAKYWGDCITVESCRYSFYATSSASIALRDPFELGGIRGGAGAISAY